MNLNALQGFYDAYNKKNEAILSEVIADDYVDYGHEPPGRGVQGAKSDQQEIARAFADARFDMDEMFGSDDRVVVRWTLHATHTGPFAGLSPTQKKAAVRGISLYRLHDGKITETRNMPIFSPCSRSSARSNKRRARRPRDSRFTYIMPVGKPWELAEQRVAFGLSSEVDHNGASPSPP